MNSVIAQNWRICGIKPGDIVLVHSSLKRTLQTHNTTPQAVMESFLEAVGPDGTVLFPSFNFDFTKGVRFDIRRTPSHMGALTEAARLHPNAMRSGHPIYSFAIIGSQAQKFAVDNLSGYGPDSPFAILRQLDGKIGVLDLDDQNSMTFYHHIEEMHGVPYRFHKKFAGQYTDANGVDLPVASVMRSKYGTYPEYHTSLDDLTLVTPSGLQGSYDVLRKSVECIEADERLAVTVLCEPQLGKRGLYPTLSTKQTGTQVRDMMNLIAYCDGTCTLLEIAEKINVPMWNLIPVAETLKSQGLLAAH